MTPRDDLYRGLMLLLAAIALIVLALALAGCGAEASSAPAPSSSSSSSSADNHGYGWQYDAMSAHGLKLRDARQAAGVRRLTALEADLLERRAATVATCAGELELAPPPFVVLLDPGELAARVGKPGWYYPNPPLIALEDLGDLFDHEALHYVLDRRGDLDAGHTSPLWASCSFAL